MDIEARIERLEKDVAELKELMIDFSSKRNELYYQKFLEKHLSATHQKNSHGITDLSNENTVIEIKHWRDYKTALGQLIAYSLGTNKRKYAYFFGQANESQRKQAIDLYKSYDISVYEFVDTQDGIQINTLFDTSVVCETKPKPSEWVQERVCYSKDSKLCLSTLCKRYYGRTNITLVEKAYFYTEANQYIVKYFANNEVRRISDSWYNLAFCDKDDPFMQWLENNIVYKRDAVLKLEDVCQLCLGKQNIHPRKKSDYKKKVETFIKLNFPNVKYEYGKGFKNDNYYRGWLNLSIKDM